jgi:hypothetical protein
MAIMIPPICPPDTESKAERTLFELFDTAPGTDDWIVLHALHLPAAKRGMDAEVDFLVLAPELGVFALEVKGGKIVRREGLWFSFDWKGRSHSLQPGPFIQASDGIYSLKKMLERNDCSYLLEPFIFGHGVLFPECVYNSKSIEDAQWQIFDERNGSDLLAYIRGLSSHYSSQWKETHEGKTKLLPTLEDMERLANLLRGDSDNTILLSSRIVLTERRLIELTEEQGRYLAGLRSNPRCLIEGAAGTGKTLLAVEEARRRAADGEKVAFFCYNRLLAQWAADYFAGLKPRCPIAYCGTFHNFLHLLVEEAGMPFAVPEDDPENIFWREALPLDSLIALEKKAAKYERLVLDEAQDLLSENYLAVLNETVEGGLANGRWSFFGDFSGQTIFNSNSTGDAVSALASYTENITRYTLTRNCRNTRQIAEAMAGLDKSLENKLPEYEDNPEGPEVIHHTCKSPEHEKLLLVTELERLVKKERVKTREITILSPHRLAKSVVAGLKPEELRGVQFHTISSYKGLENSVVILVDVRPPETEAARRLLYVGMSRARSQLIIFSLSKPMSKA